MCAEKGEGEEDSNRLFIHVFTAHARPDSHGVKMPSQKNRACSRTKEATAIRGRPARHEKTCNALTSLNPSASSATVFLFPFCIFVFHLLRPHMRHTDTFPLYLWTEQQECEFENLKKYKKQKRATVSWKYAINYLCRPRSICLFRNISCCFRFRSVRLIVKSMHFRWATFLSELQTTNFLTHGPMWALKFDRGVEGYDPPHRRGNIYTHINI